jgi:hypothetical protein
MEKRMAEADKVAAAAGKPTIADILKGAAERKAAAAQQKAS